VLGIGPLQRPQVQGGVLREGLIEPTSSTPTSSLAASRWTSLKIRYLTSCAFVAPLDGFGSDLMFQPGISPVAVCSMNS
jgi:hypothetical protein